MHIAKGTSEVGITVLPKGTVDTLLSVTSVKGVKFPRVCVSEKPTFSTVPRGTTLNDVAIACSSRRVHQMGSTLRQLRKMFPNIKVICFNYLLLGMTVRTCTINNWDGCQACIVEDASMREK